MSPLKRSNTVILTLSGVLAGVIIGFGISLLLFEKRLDDFLSADLDEKELKEISDQKVFDKNSKKRVRDSEKPHDTTPVSKPITTGIDTLQPAVDTIKHIVDEGSEVVLRDEMISARSIKVSMFDERIVRENTTEKFHDSLIKDLTAVKPSLKKPQEYLIEFWVNPVNYRGYKIIRDRIILFGLPPEKKYTLYYNNGMLVLETEGSKYHLREFAGFLPLIPQN